MQGPATYAPWRTRGGGHPTFGTGSQGRRRSARLTKQGVDIMGRRRLVAGLAVVTMLMTGCTTAVSGAGSAGTPASANGTTTPSGTTTSSPVPDDGESTDPTRVPPPSGGSRPGTGQSTAGTDQSTAETGTASADLVGPNVGFIRAVDVPAGNLTFDRITWFTGPEVAEACATDAVPRHGADRQVVRDLLLPEQQSAAAVRRRRPGRLDHLSAGGRFPSPAPCRPSPSTSRRPPVRSRRTASW